MVTTPVIRYQRSGQRLLPVGRRDRTIGAQWGLTDDVIDFATPIHIDHSGAMQALGHQSPPLVNDGSIMCNAVSLQHTMIYGKREDTGVSLQFCFCDAPLRTDRADIVGNLLVGAHDANNNQTALGGGTVEPGPCVVSHRVHLRCFDTHQKPIMGGGGRWALAHSRDRMSILAPVQVGGRA